MKIKEIRAFAVDLSVQPKTRPRSPSKAQGTHMSRPIARYADVKEQANPPWNRAACILTAEDGTWGFGVTIHGGPVIRIINDHFARPWLARPAWGLRSCGTQWCVWPRPTAASVWPVTPSAPWMWALWDLKGKLLGKPVYELLGGPQKEKIFCYATGFDTEWYLELGFKATKIFATHGPQDGLDGLGKNEELVAKTRELVGDDVELMLDCWMSMDEEYVVRLAERLRPYRLKWIEDYVLPDDLAAYETIRARIPWQTLASGEHWYLPTTFATAARRNLVDIFQPDVLWGGGVTAAVKICHLAQATGKSVITHAGMNYPFGQHVAYAMPAVIWGERSEGVSPPGVPLDEMSRLPGTPAIKDGYLVPSDAPGFGLEITPDWLEQVAV